MIAMDALPASTTMISFVRSLNPVCLIIIAYVFPKKENKALIISTERRITEKFSVKFFGTTKLNLRRKASINDMAQITKSILKMIQDGVVDLKNLIDLTMKEFELMLSMGQLFSWSIFFNVHYLNYNLLKFKTMRNQF